MLEIARLLVLAGLTVSAAVIDIRRGIIPDKLNLLGLLLGIPLILESREVFLSGVSGFLFCGGLLLVIAFLTKGGMGGGDIKLAAVMGLLLGLKQVALAISLAFAFGGLVGLALIILGKAKLKDTVPFGPYLAMGVLGAVLFGDKYFQI